MKFIFRDNTKLSTHRVITKKLKKCLQKTINFRTVIFLFFIKSKVLILITYNSQVSV